MAAKSVIDGSGKLYGLLWVRIEIHSRRVGQQLFVDISPVHEIQSLLFVPVALARRADLELLKNVGYF